MAEERIHSSDDKIYSKNRLYVEKSKEYLKVAKGIVEHIEFVRDFSDLLFDRAFVTIGDHLINLSNLFQSLEFTLHNLYHCCLNYCMADANILLRKYRDDLFFALYSCSYYMNITDEIKPSETKRLKTVGEMEANLLNWLNGKLSNLHFGTVVKHINELPSAAAVSKQYDLKRKFDEMGKELNNYVHGNGRNFYNECYWKTIDPAKPIREVKEITQKLAKITVTFLLLVAICVPHYIMSTDYTDCLDFGLTPSDGSQFLVAPFVEEYLKAHLDLIDPECYRYLQENTSMELD